MKDYTMFNYEFLFNDHFSKVSINAKLLYIQMCFFANAGFVPNPKQLCKELGFTTKALQELIDNGEILTKEGRSEVVITSYFIHNKNFEPLWWTKTPYATYWYGYLWVKKNRVFTLKKPKEQNIEIETPSEEEKVVDPIVKKSSKKISKEQAERFANLTVEEKINLEGQEAVDYQVWLEEQIRKRNKNKK